MWLVHGTSREDKEWPEHQWQALARRLNDAGYQLQIPAGSDAEVARAYRIAGGTTAKIWERASLTDIKNAMDSATQVIAVDTGLAHLADALQRPLLMLFGPTQPGLVGPLSPNSQIIQRDRMDQISAAEVVEAIEGVRSGE